MTFWIRGWFWVLAVLGLIWAPVLVAPLFEVPMVDAGKCSLGPACEKLNGR